MTRILPIAAATLTWGFLAMQPAPRPAPPAPDTNAARWATATIRPEWRRRAEQAAQYLRTHKLRYEAVERRTAVPWYVVGALHQMECSGSFRHHLHEGSPLTGPTRDVPKGRPPGWNPLTMTWADSATDALVWDHMGTKDWRTPGPSLDACESYNGLGYRRRNVPSPYLWSGTTAYACGKYIRDGVWSATAISKQVGIAAIWRAGEFL
jgi:lysozyme family protein